MPIPNRDDDEFRAMGYVCVYAAYVEEEIDLCYRVLRYSDPRHNPRIWGASAKVDSCIRAIRALPSHGELREMLPFLNETKALLRDRNTAVHSPLYARPGGGNVRRGRPGDEERFVTAAEIYDLAEDLFDCDGWLRDREVRIARFVHEARTGRR